MRLIVFPRVNWTWFDRFFSHPEQSKRCENGSSFWHKMQRIKATHILSCQNLFHVSLFRIWSEISKINETFLTQEFVWNQKWGIIKLELGIKMIGFFLLRDPLLLLLLLLGSRVIKELGEHIFRRGRRRGMCTSRDKQNFSLLCLSPRLRISLAHHQNSIRGAV